MKEMDLREALRWCYRNKGERLKVNGSSDVVQIRMTIVKTAHKDGIGYTQDCLIQGRAYGEWQNLRGWWWDITGPHVTFSVIEDNEDKLKELENKQRELAKEQERLADEIRRLKG